MLYLAQIERKNLKRSIDIKLIAIRRSNYWLGLDDVRTINVPLSTTKLQDNAIAIVELNEPETNKFVKWFALGDKDCQILNIIPANSNLIGNNYKAKEKEIELWKQSLNFQSQELMKRTHDLEQRIADVKQIEEKLKQIAITLEAERISLKNSWAALGYERESKRV